MIKKYIYQNEEYSSSQAVKRAIEKSERKRFGAEPDGTLEEKQAFWAEHSVTYTEEPDPEPTLDELKQEKLNDLEYRFKRWYEQDAVVTSSLGFVADSDARAVTDVTGLITVAQSTPAGSRSAVAFMDHENQAHMLDLAQLKTLQLEIIQNGQSAYQQKWTMRSAIETAENEEALSNLEIAFVGLDFSKEATTL